jgi:hypothetical protein
MLWVLFRQESIKLIALVPEEEYSIKELAENIAELSGVTNLTFDTSKADGQFKKTMGNAILR